MHVSFGVYICGFMYVRLYVFVCVIVYVCVYGIYILFTNACNTLIPRPGFSKLPCDLFSTRTA